MTDRETALRRLGVGDLFHGRSPTNRASLICLVTSLSDSTIFARRVTTQEDLQFDRKTGIKRGDVPSRIDCVAPYPPDIYDAILALDRRYETLLQMERNGVELDLKQARLTPEEKRAFRAMHEHIAANPI